MRRTTILRGAAVLTLAVLAACDDGPTTAAPEKQPDDLARQVEALGFRGDMVRDFGDYVVVEGDIRLTRAQLRSPQPAPSGDPLRPRFQYRTNALVGSPGVHQITVDVSGLAAEPGWQTAALNAMAQWNAVPGSYVRMVQGAPADITVVLGCLPWNWAAEATWPSGGNPGNIITVNRVGCIGLGLNDQQRLHNMVHEFGHTLGFRHSNWVQADCDVTFDTNCSSDPAPAVGVVHVPGTPASGNDAGSVMNGGTALNAWAGFSAADLLATRMLYPLPTPVPTVSNAGGDPLVSWGALVGATGYQVEYVELVRERNDRVITSWEDVYPRGTTSGTSYLDTGAAYTGKTLCTYGSGLSNSVTYYYRYRVTALFPTGSTTAEVSAPVGPC